MLSVVGVMFAPFHQPVADELVRVTRSGGTIALANWTPQGFIGQMFAAMKPYAAAPPPGASPGPLWGTEDHVRELFGDRVSHLQATREPLPVDRFATGAEFRDFFKARYGPTIAAYRNIADDPERDRRARPGARRPRRPLHRGRVDAVGVPARGGDPRLTPRAAGPLCRPGGRARVER